ncbi:unnamed protein product [Diamesa hyperborea]
MSSRRPRRSRIYDANYNMGENYYKSAIDRLDEKYSHSSSGLTRRSEPVIETSPPRTRFNLGTDSMGLEDDLTTARERASKAIHDETILDTRTGRKAFELESQFDGQIQKTLSRLQQSKKLISSLDLENNYDSNENSSNVAVSRRAVKVVSDISSSAAKSSDLTKWSKMSDYNDSESFAAVRARQSAARILDIEQDMADRNQRQFQREQRSANVKKLLAETADMGSLSNDVSSLKITKTTKHATKLKNRTEHNLDVAANHLTVQVYQVIEHFKQIDPVGLPMLPLPDPMPVPNIKQGFSMGTMQMTNVSLYGTSQFRIKHVRTEVKEMKADCGIQLDSLTLNGSYTLSSLFTRSQGPFTITLKNVFVNGNATIGVERDGKLRTQNISIDITFTDMNMDFKNLGFMATIFQGLANSASNFVFDAIKPFLLNDAYSKIRTLVDQNLDKMVGDYGQMPNSISPIDNAIAEARKQIRNKGFDPYHVKDYNHPGVFGVKISNTWIYGISSFYRVGDISLAIVNNSAIIAMEVGTQELIGSTTWEFSIAKGVITRTGNVQFTVQHIKVAYEVAQPMDLSKRLKIMDLQLELGNIQVRCNGLGTVDYLIEFFVNVLPNMLRYQIMDALEKPVMRKIQEIVDKIDMEQLLKEKMEEFQRDGKVEVPEFDFDML